MTKLLFSKIPALLFEPVFVAALLGILIAVAKYRKKRGPFFLTIIAVAGGAFVWRFACHPIMISKRYLLLLLYPAIIFAGWFCFYFKCIMRWLTAKFHLSETNAAILRSGLISCIPITVLTIVCIVKTLRHDPYSSYTIKICQTLKKDSMGKNALIFTADELERFTYYAGGEKNNIQRLDPTRTLYESIREELLAHQNFIITMYVAFYLPQGKPEPTLAYLNLPPSIGEWKCIHREYTSRRKKKEMLLYRFVPAHEAIRTWEGEIPQMSVLNLCKNGDFEQSLTGDTLDKRISYYKNIKASDFYTMPGRLFPQNWWLWISEDSPGQFSEMSLTGEQPIAGKYSLKLKGDDHELASVNSDGMPVKDGKIFGFLHAVEKSMVYVALNYFDIVQNRIIFTKRLAFSLDAGKTYRFSIPVRSTDFPENISDYTLIIQNSGHVIVDNIQFIPDALKR